MPIWNLFDDNCCEKAIKAVQSKFYSRLKLVTAEKWLGLNVRSPEKRHMLAGVHTYHGKTDNIVNKSGRFSKHRSIIRCKNEHFS